MQTQQNICDILQNSNQLPPLALLYGRCLGVTARNNDWTTLRLADDTGEMLVHIQSNLIVGNDALLDECMLLVNDSGSATFFFDQSQGLVCAVIKDSRDLGLKQFAYRDFRRRTGKDEQAQAGAAAVQQAAAAVQQQATTTAETAVVTPMATVPAQTPPAPLPLATQVKLDTKSVSETPISMMTAPWDLFAATMLDCLETSTVVISEYVRRHPEQHNMLNAGMIKEMATTFFIQAAKGGVML